MPTAKSARKSPKATVRKNSKTKTSLSIKFPKTKTIGRWIYVYDDAGNVVRQVMRPFGKTRLPFAEVVKNVRAVITENLKREAEEDQ